MHAGQLKGCKWHKSNRWRWSVCRACVCLCAGRRLAGVKWLWIYQLPGEGQKQGLPDTPPHTHTHTSRLTTLNIPPSLSMPSSFRYLLFGSLLLYCFHPSIYPSIFLYFLWMESEQVSFPFPSPLTSFCSPHLSLHPLLLLRLCHWHSR